MIVGTKELYQLDDSIPIFYTIGNWNAERLNNPTNGTTDRWQSQHEKPVLTTLSSRFFPPVVYLGGKLGKASSFLS